MNTHQYISAALAIGLAIIFTLVAAGRVSWMYFWIASAVLLIYVTYALPGQNGSNSI